MQPAVFLDRDNTLIDNGGDLGDPKQVRLLDGVAEGLRSLRDAGFSLVVVTNQAGVARGKFTEDDVDAVHQRIAMLADGQTGYEGVIDRFYYCPYHPEGTVTEYRRDHPWRKPHPGMILQASRDMGLDLSRSWMIGDQERDVEAARAAGCKFVLVTRDAALAQRAQPTEVAGTFRDAVKRVLRDARPNGQSNGGPVAAPVRKPVPKQGSAPASGPGGGRASEGDAGGIRRAIVELTEEIRSDRLRRADFTLVKMIAGVFQLVALMLALLGLLQLSNSDVFTKWMIGAALIQLVTLTLLVLDLKA